MKKKNMLELNRLDIEQYHSINFLLIRYIYAE